MPENNEQIQKQLTQLNKTKESLSTIAKNLDLMPGKIDQIIKAQIESWHTHQKKHFNLLFDELEAIGITLTEIEQSDLLRITSTPSATDESLNKIEKLGLKLPKNPSAFITAVYAVIVSATSRTLKKIDNSAIKDLTKKLSVIKKEEQEFKKLVKLFKEQHTDLKNQVNEITNQIKNTKLISKAELKILEEKTAAAELPKRDNALTTEI